MRLALCVVVLCLSAYAGATKPTLRLERIDPSSFASDGKLRVFASLVELEGQVDDSKRGFSLVIDGKRPITAEKTEPFRAAAVPLDLVLVVESSALYGPQKQKTDVPFDHVKEALTSLLETRDGKTRVFVVDYGGDVTPHPPFQNSPAAAGAIDDLTPDGESGDLHLVDAVRAALVELGKARPKDDNGADVLARKLIVVISDGLNAQMERSTFRALGDAAAQARVPIHSIAFSPSDDRGPLLNLGEISKRSNGTFRWAKSSEELKAQIETLADELDKQYVLTFSPPIDALDGHSFQLKCEGMTSNVLTWEPGGAVFGWKGDTARHSLVWTIGKWAGAIFGGLLLLYLGFAIVLRLATSGNAGASLTFPDGRIVQLRKKNVLGKSGAIVVDDAAASSRHCSIVLDAGGWLVTDLGSTNGTWVDGARLTQPMHIHTGQTLQLGQTRLRFTVTRLDVRSTK